MIDKLVIRSVCQTCSACPSQWDLYTDTGKYTYVRYRFGYFSADINAFTEKEESLFSTEIGEDLDGVMSTGEMIELLSPYLDFTNVQFK